jgi:hypothetical protein
MVFYFPPGNLWDEDSVATHFVGFFSTRKFAACKQSLLGKSASELAMYTDQAPPDALPPHAEVTDLRCNLMLCGLGGLSEKQIAALLTSHGMPLAGLSGSDMYLIPVADSAAEDLGRHFKAGHGVGGVTSSVLEIYNMWQIVALYSIELFMNIAPTVWVRMLFSLCVRVSQLFVLEQCCPPIRGALSCHIPT